MGNLAILPTPAAIEAAWLRYSHLMRSLLDTPELALNRAHMENLARVERAWKDAFLAQDERR